MTQEKRQALLCPPRGVVDVVLDTDAFNEIDDQFALSYLVRSPERAHTVALYAAPFHNRLSTGPADGMEKSYAEILRLLDFMEIPEGQIPVYRGSKAYLPDESTPVVSPAAEDLCRRAGSYSEDNPLYVVAIGAITNVASALLLDPSIKDRIVVVWLGGHTHAWPSTREFNMMQDVAAARVVMGSGAPFVQLPCMGTVSEFRLSKPEIEAFLLGKNPLADYLGRNTVRAAESYAAGTCWTRVIWDVTAVAWLFNGEGRFLSYKTVPTLLPDYTHHYEKEALPLEMSYVYEVKRDALMTDLVRTLTR